MKRQPWALYAIALAILVVGLVAFGVPAQTFLFGAAVLACPLMMLFMHGGHGSTHHAGHGVGGDGQRADHARPTMSVPDGGRPRDEGGPR
ncbi:DUF2933 domain-containing protein [Actinoplanes sp. NPDC051513]|uniref:DUF2933 domain-containing protein n=1 Tax=Actinoplanes sp. NPDC051513 TaxID=3363908 RepID=UPI0037B821D6